MRLIQLLNILFYTLPILAILIDQSRRHTSQRNNECYQLTLGAYSLHAARAVVIINLLNTIK